MNNTFFLNATVIQYLCKIAEKKCWMQTTKLQKNTFTFTISLLSPFTVPPRIEGDQKSAELVALVGENVTLPCEVVGSPWPQIKWKKDLRTIDFFNTNHK